MGAWEFFPGSFFLDGIILKGKTNKERKGIL